MRWARLFARCLLLIVLSRCYQAPAVPDVASYAVPHTGNGNDGNGSLGAMVSVGGTVSGLLPNQRFVMSDGVAQITITANGAFSFANTIAVGQVYRVYVVSQPVAQACYVTVSQGQAPATGVNVAVLCQLMLRFSSGQAARTVLGQPDFVSYARNHNQTVAAANSASNPWGTSYTSSNGIVYLSDSLNCRVLGFNALPSDNGHAADFELGQPDFASAAAGCSAASLGYVSGVASDHRGGLFVTDMLNNRVLLFAHEFTGAGAAATGALGQTSLDTNTSGCSATTLSTPLSSATDGTVLAVSDASNNRVLLWSPLPAADSLGAPATMVLGQPNLTTCTPPTTTGAQTLKSPQGVWTNGQVLAAVSVDENRVLLWHALPTLIAAGVNGVAADAVIGQPDLHSSAAGSGAEGLLGPQYVISDGLQLIVTDTGNNRVLVYNTLNPNNGAAASTVLGQVDYVGVAPRGGANGFWAPDGLGISGKSLIVSDAGNDRFLIFDSL